MVASTHWLASGVGMSVLERGGNAFDAAVAAGFVLQVVEPHLNGPGGDVPVVLASGDEVRVLCGQGPAPAGATIDAYRARGLDLVPGVGPLAAVVPGAFDAWALMLRDYGTWELADVMAPAIAYARDGYPVVPGIVAAIRGVEDQLRTDWTSSAEVYLPAPRRGGAVPQRSVGGVVRAARAGERRVARGAHRRGARRLLPRLGRGGGRLVLRHGGRVAERGRHGGLAGDVRGPGHARLPRPHDLQDRPVGAGPGHAPAARAARGLRPRLDVAGRVRAHGRRVREARVRRPRGLVRRPRFRRRAAGGAAERGLRGRAACAGGRARVGRVAPRRA